MKEQINPSVCDYNFTRPCIGQAYLQNTHYNSRYDGLTKHDLLMCLAYLGRRGWALRERVLITLTCILTLQVVVEKFD